MGGAYRTADATVSAFNAVAVTPHDSNTIQTTRALYVGGSGDISVRMASGASVLFKGVPVGVFPIQVDMVKSTSTTATNMVALY